MYFSCRGGCICLGCPERVSGVLSTRIRTGDPRRSIVLISTPDPCVSRILAGLAGETMQNSDQSSESTIAEVLVQRQEHGLFADAGGYGAIPGAEQRSAIIHDLAADPHVDTVREGFAPELGRWLSTTNW